MWSFRRKETVSRVLFRPKLRTAMIIHLGQALPTASSDRTRRLSGEQPVSHLAPPRYSGKRTTGAPPYLVLLRVGFTESRCHHRDWCALTAPFHPYQAKCTAVTYSVYGPGGLFSVALSLGSPPLDVIQHPALRSPDFPLPTCSGKRSSGPLHPGKGWRFAARAKRARVSLWEAVGLKRFDGQQML